MISVFHCTVFSEEIQCWRELSPPSCSYVQQGRAAGSTGSFLLHGSQIALREARDCPSMAVLGWTLCNPHSGLWWQTPLHVTTGWISFLAKGFFIFFIFIFFFPMWLICKRFSFPNSHELLDDKQICFSKHIYCPLIELSADTTNSAGPRSLHSTTTPPCLGDFLDSARQTNITSCLKGKCKYWLVTRVFCHKALCHDTVLQTMNKKVIRYPFFSPKLEYFSKYAVLNVFSAVQI